MLPVPLVAPLILADPMVKVHEKVVPGTPATMEIGALFPLQTDWPLGLKVADTEGITATIKFFGNDAEQPATWAVTWYVTESIVFPEF